jgi:adenylate cyclase
MRSSPSRLPKWRLSQRIATTFMARRPLHLHISLIFGSLFLVLALALVTFAYATGRATALSQASVLVDARLDNLISRSIGQLTEVEAVVAALANTSKLAVAGRGDPTGKFTVLKETLSRLPVVDGLYVGYPDGDFAHLVSLKSEAWRRSLAAPAVAEFAFRIISIAPNGSRSSMWAFYDSDGRFLTQAQPTDTEYDPRVRPWFRLAKANSGIAWTPPYVFATTRQIGFTISSIMRDMPGVVVAADITLEHLGQLFEEQKITSGTRVMLFDENGGLLAFSGMKDAAGIGASAVGNEAAVNLTTGRDPLMQEVYRRSTVLGWSPIRSFSLELGGQDYVATVKSARPSSNQRVFMAMATPVRELTANVARTNLNALGMSPADRPYVTSHCSGCRSQAFAAAQQAVGGGPQNRSLRPCRKHPHSLTDHRGPRTRRGNELGQDGTEDIRPIRSS